METRDRHTEASTWLVIPAYQAEKTIGRVFERIPQCLADKNTAVVVIDDGSKDNTAEVVRAIANDFFLPVDIIRKEPNEGYARAQKTGFRYALAHGAIFIALLHADGQYAPEKLPELLSPLENEQADVVLGSRMAAGGALQGGMPVYKFIANKCLTALENFVYGLRLSEYHSGYMLYHRRFLEAFPFEKLSDTFHFDGEMLMVAGKKGFRIKEVAIPTHYGDEVSHLKPIRYGFDVLKTVFRYMMGKYNF